MNRKIYVSVFLILFVLLSFIYISPFVNPKRSRYRSSDLKQFIRKEENVERIDYLDSEGNITVAADTGYATVIRTKTPEGIMEKYYDDKGVGVRRQAGYFAVLRQYDDTGKNTCNTFLNEEYNPCIIKDGYAIEKREYNENNQIIAVRYFDTEREPICTASYGYVMINEYDEDGKKYKTTYTDSFGKPIMTNLGYAFVIRQYNSDSSVDGGRADNEFYYDEMGKPVALSLGQYGLHKEYNELGQGIVLTYLDSEGKPTVTTEGYTTIIRTFMADNSVATEQYYDLEGKPFSLSEGQYGFKRENGQTVFLNENGNDTFNLRNLLYNSSWVVIPFAIIAVIIASLGGKRLNFILLIPCIFTIIYLTLLFRENIGYKGIIFLESYRSILVDSEARSDIIRNLWLFIPFGAILYRLYPHKKILIIPVILCISIECIQYYAQTGFCELDDIINNSLGSCIGFYMEKLTAGQIQRIKSWKHIHNM